MAVPGSASELQAPRFVCNSCGALFHHTPDACPICTGVVLPRVREVAAPHPHLDARRRRIVYGIVGGWLLLLVIVVAVTALRDPTLGHAGRTVYPNEEAVASSRLGAKPDQNGPLRTFRLSKADHIEKIGGPPGPVPTDVWIRITSGPHAGRTGVIAW